MSSATVDDDNILRLYDRDQLATHDRLFVKEIRTNNIELARVSSNGIIREADGPACYSSGPYEIYETDLNRGVVISNHSNRKSFHTSHCRSIKRGKKSKRRIVEIEQAVMFYDLRHCHNCAKKADLDHRELQKLVKFDFTT